MLLKGSYKRGLGYQYKKSTKKLSCDASTSCVSPTHQNLLVFSFKPSHTISHHLSKNHIKTKPYSCSPAQLCLLDSKDVAQNRQEVSWFNRKPPLFQKSSILVLPWACWRWLQWHKTHRRKTELLKHFPLSRFAVKVHLGTNPHFSLRIIQA